MRERNRLWWACTGVWQAVAWTIGAAIMAVTLTLLAGAVWLADAVGRTRDAWEWRAFVRRRVREELARPYRGALPPARRVRRSTP